MNTSGDAKVCLVDDDSSVLRSMQYLLASDGITVRAFNKPEEFLVHAADHPVSVVVTDIWMEGVTVWKFSRACVPSRRAPRDRDYSARCLAARATAMAIGPVAFFIKPFNDEEFLAAVRKALTQAKN